MTPVDPADALLAWGLAEIPEEHRQRGAPLAASPALRRKIVDGEALDGEDREQVLRVMRGNRAEARELLDGGYRWYEAELEGWAVGDVAIDAHWLWTALGAAAPLSSPWRRPHPRTIRELAAHPDRPASTLSGEFALEQMRGRPLLIATSLSGPWCAVEGTNRLVGMWGAPGSLSGPHDGSQQRAPGTVPVLLGVSDGAGAWKLRDLWLALGSLDWEPGKRGGIVRARTPWKDRPFALACPRTRRAAAVSEPSFARLAAPGVPELESLEGAWEWVG